MAATFARRGPPVRFTLLDLVRALGEQTESDQEVVAAVLDLLESGRVRLSGSFRDDPPTR